MRWKNLSKANFMKEIIETFIKLVQIDSPSGKEQGMITYIQNWLKQNKFSYKIDKQENILANNNVPGKPILFCSHMDTVEPGKGIKPQIKNGFITSSGNTILGADNKAVIACLLTILGNNNFKKPIELLFTVKEETGGGVEHFPFQWIKSKLGIIFDFAKPLGGIVVQSPYISNFIIELKGKSAHSSIPQKEKNPFIPAFIALSKMTIGKTDNSKTTINIGTIKGGTGINIIPSNIKIEGEIRSYDHKLLEKNLKKIKNLFNKDADKYKIEIKFSKNGFCPGYLHDKKDLLIKVIKKTYQEFGLMTKYYVTTGVSDANILNKAGIKTFTLSDGVISPHTVNEKIKIEDLKTLSEIINKLLRNFSGESIY